MQHMEIQTWTFEVGAYFSILQLFKWICGQWTIDHANCSFNFLLEKCVFLRVEPQQNKSGD